MDLNDLGRDRERWVEMGGALKGVDFLVRFASPRESERFRRTLVQKGIMRTNRQGAPEMAMGREEDYCREFAKFYVLDWRGDVKPDGSPYDAEKMAAVMLAYRVAYERLHEAIAEEEAFFSPNGSGPT